LKIKSILVSQPKPSTAKSPYFDLAEKNNIKIDFRPFIQVEGISAKEFRQTRIHILEHSAIIFTSRTAIDHFFRISQDLRLTIPDNMKYFCISEATAYYLQKYIVYRKRKIFYGNGNFSDLVALMKKHKDENLLVPLSDIHKQEIPELLDKGGFKYTKAILYRTVSSDLSDLRDVNYDILVFFSPFGNKVVVPKLPRFSTE
jgi:uroporphyrinogen-III synthase